MIKCIVLDYTNGDVNMHEFSEDELIKATTENIDLSDIIESMLAKMYNLTSINYMFGDNININI